MTRIASEPVRFARHGESFTFATQSVVARACAAAARLRYELSMRCWVLYMDRADEMFC